MAYGLHCHEGDPMVLKRTHIKRDTAPVKLWKSMNGMHDKQIGQLEEELVIAYNAFSRLIRGCLSDVGLIGFGTLDALIFQLVCRNANEIRLVDICVALKIEDQHTVNYSLKKMKKAALLVSKRQGKIVLYQSTEQGRATYIAFLEQKEICLKGIHGFGLKGSMESAILQDGTKKLQLVGELYEQAFRRAAWGTHKLA